MFFGFGYVNSDAVFYKKVIKINSLKTPKDVFFYLNMNIHNRVKDSLLRYYPTLKGVPVRDMIECNRGFWCDEGAIAMSKFLDYLPTKYPWRLVDIYGTDNVSHHTVIQAFSDSKWVTYDIFFQTDSLPPEKTVSYKVLYVKFRNWSFTTKVYHYIIERNTVLKYFLLKFRGVY